MSLRPLFMYVAAEGERGLGSVGKGKSGLCFSERLDLPPEGEPEANR
jgi:hypothetical protein